MKKKTKDFLKSIIESVLLALIISILLLNFVLMSVGVDGSSMEPNLYTGDRGLSFIVNKLNGIERFDIAVIKVDGADKMLIKRVIGLPNEKIEWLDNRLYVNGKYIKEDFLGENIITADYAIELKDDEYLCVGDNRPISRDSRNYYGPFSLKEIVATDIFIFYPFNRISYK